MGLARVMYFCLDFLIFRLFVLISLPLNVNVDSVKFKNLLILYYSTFISVKIQKEYLRSSK